VRGRDGQGQRFSSLVLLTGKGNKGMAKVRVQAGGDGGGLEKR
jgi:hypothetical protein